MAVVLGLLKPKTKINALDKFIIPLGPLTNLEGSLNKVFDQFKEKTSKT